MVAPDPVGRPQLRGVLHQAAFSVSLVVGTLLIVYADGARQRLAAAIFAGSVSAMLAASSLYHRVMWSPPWRQWMRRIDHAGKWRRSFRRSEIVLRGAWQTVVLAIVWSGAAMAIVLKFAWVEAPKWLAAAIGIALGWVGVVVLPQLLDRSGVPAVVLLAVGGVAYTAGAIVYARRRPDPVPQVFGYHELFHALTIVAVACQYVAVAFWVVRVG